MVAIVAASASRVISHLVPPCREPFGRSLIDELVSTTNMRTTGRSSGSLLQPLHALARRSAAVFFVSSPLPFALPPLELPPLFPVVPDIPPVTVITLLPPVAPLPVAPVTVPPLPPEAWP